MTRTVESLTRGDVILVLLPNSDLRTAKTRPAVVVEAEDLNTGIRQIVVAMVTSRLNRAGHACRVLLRLGDATGQHSGLLRDSVVMTDNLATVFESAIARRIGSITMANVDQALRHTLGL